jgi:predicted TIM-barrel fold metal-dependent hydrolase
LQFFYPDDERMNATYAACVDLDVPIVAHGGPDRGGAGYGDPARWARVLTQFPRLKLVLAHLGGGYWSGVPAFASAYPTVRFDLSEIVNWVGGTRAPTPGEFGALIRDVGANRVMFGSDFPWYDLVRTIDLIHNLPGLASDEHEQILGLNAAELLILPR